MQRRSIQHIGDQLVGTDTDGNLIVTLAVKAYALRQAESGTAVGDVCRQFRKIGSSKARRSSCNLSRNGTNVNASEQSARGCRSIGEVYDSRCPAVTAVEDSAHDQCPARRPSHGHVKSE